MSKLRCLDHPDQQCVCSNQDIREQERAAAIKLWERQGRLVPTCPSCREIYEFAGMPAMAWVPNHQPSDACESGKRSHCTCDMCF